MLQEHRREVLEEMNSLELNKEDMDREKLYKQWFALLAVAIPAKRMRMLIEDFGHAKTIFDCSEGAICNCRYLDENNIAEILNARKRGLPVNQAGRWEADNICFVSIEDEAYPVRLKNLEDRPYALWYKGKLPDEGTPTVGIIGARNCSDYGRRSAAYFGKELAKAGVSVISGMAVGIDGLSQGACLKEGGKSYGLLGSGPDVIYPSANEGLYRSLLQSGGVISEFIPGTPAVAKHFPMRNRLISAFSDVLLVIEARERSGTFITVGYALEQGKDVYALPGRIDDALSAGCNRLIRDGAGIAACADDILFELEGRMQAHREIIKSDGLSMSERIRQEKKKNKREKENDNIIHDKDPLNNMIFRILRDHERDPEEMMVFIRDNEKAPDDLTLPLLMGRLMELELEDRVCCRGGMYYLPDV
ncbi:DNA processing protein [Lachnospiraceae bacterium XPB1003]|nr:DNA processing protein [Lachnospiraceae bacterium XPB1003]